LEVFQTPPLAYTIPIPRDYLTLTHQPEYQPSVVKKINVPHKQHCDNFYLNDYYKQNCYNKMARKANDINVDNTSYNQYFFHPNVPEY